jgi:hypothetical protein
MNVALTWNQLCSSREYNNFHSSKSDFYVSYCHPTPTNGNGLNAPCLAKEFNLYVLILSGQLRPVECLLTHIKNFSLSTEYLPGTFVYYTAPSISECLYVAKNGSSTYTDYDFITEFNAKAEFEKLKRHLQDPKYDPFRR